MADPLSITAAAVAFGGVAVKTVKILKSFRHGNTEVEALIEQIENISLVVTTVQGCCELYSDEAARHNDGLSAVIAKIKIVVERAKKDLEALDELLQYDVLKPMPVDALGKPAVRKLKWASLKADTDRVREKLKERMDVMNVLMTAVQTYNINRVWMPLRNGLEIAVHTSKLPNRRRIESPTLSFESDTQAGNAQSSEALIAHDQDVSILNTLARGSELETSISCTMSHGLQNNSYTGPPGLRIQQRSFRRGACRLFCPCKCHVSTRLRTPGNLQALIGTLILDCSGIWSPKCSDGRCKKLKTTTVRIDYWLPPWLLDRAFRLWYSNAPGVPTIVLNTPRVRPWSELGYFRDLILDGNISALEESLCKGEWSPYDCDETGNNFLEYTFIHLRYIWGSVESAIYLINKGCDLLETNILEESALDTLFSWVILLPHDHDNAIESRKLLAGQMQYDLSDIAQARGMSPLHLAVAGIHENPETLSSSQSIASPHLLKRALLENALSINEIDKQGASPLTYAILQEDIASVQVLLEAGADPNIGIWDDDRSNLHIACGRLRCSEIVRLLLDYDADIEAINELGETPIVRTASREVLDIMLDRGADPQPALDHLWLRNLEHDARLIEFGAIIRKRTILNAMRDFSWLGNMDTLSFLVVEERVLDNDSGYQQAAFRGIWPDITIPSGHLSCLVSLLMKASWTGAWEWFEMEGDQLYDEIIAQIPTHWSTRERKAFLSALDELVVKTKATRLGEENIETLDMVHNSKWDGTDGFINNSGDILPSVLAGGARFEDVTEESASDEEEGEESSFEEAVEFHAPAH